ncbi:TonB-dependent receptor domain-containing protein [Novosphingobium huizhouense]|uniref:TonB-dependent receptor domain-containing protein n=1 Tax=Novosphingobium huizhouense TaxID=2866625 RepID=UPI001CD8F11E|nr:TonB-dependent receptor [Novosphingobium huizhouense]
MKNFSKLKAGVAPAALCLAMVAQTAFAQEAATPPQASDDAEPQQQIVVTGSLIRNPNLVQATPVNVTTSDQIELKQSNTAEEVLREVPGIVANIGSAVNNGNGGSSYVDLRGLGSNRNIVLIDGQRIVPADLSGRVDLNNIPLALINRVDALTGAAVTTYGADAITGVVNFVTKKDFSGVDISVSDQITQKGDGNYFRADITTGVNFDDGRGNAVLSLGYQNSNPIYQGDRDFSYYQLDSFSGTAGGSGTSIPSRFTGTRPLISGTGLINTTPALTQTGTLADGTPILAEVEGGAANGGSRQLNDLGQAVGTYARFNFNPYNIFQTPFRRFNIFAQANYQLSDAVEVYTRGMFVKNTIKTIIAPSGSFGGSVTVNLNNPFLPAALRNQFCAFNVAPVVNGVDADGNAVSGQIAYTPRFSQAECAAAATATDSSDPNYRTVTVNLNRRAVEVGPRISDYTSQVFDYRLGFRGALTSTVDWDVSGSYGESDKVQTIQNYTLQSRIRNALLVNGTAANPVCEDSTDGCVPADVFTAGGISKAAASYISQNSTTTVRTSLLQARGLLSGDFGWSVPSASEPVGFALGTEYRKYTAKQASDLLSKTPGELGGAGGAAPDIDGAYDVWEAYGELIAPLVTDKPFFKSLTVEGGARYSKYKVRGGGSTDTWTYKAGGSWEPIADLKIRGNYAHAVRAPNIGELFTPLTTGLTNLATDPCAGSAPVSNANLRAVCLAQGAPAGVIGSIENPTAAQANVTSGGNLNLQPEKANTWTIGAVIQPAAIRGFALSVDYYNISVTDVIGAPLPGDLVDACFNNVSASSATDPACTVIRRNPVTGGLDGDPATTAGLFAPLSNLGRLSTSGIDVILSYSYDFGAVKWNLTANGNYTAHSKYKATPTSLYRECVGYYSVNCSFTGSIQPKYQWSVRNTFGIGRADVSFLWRHISGVRQEPADVLATGPAFEGTIPDGSGALSGKTVNFGKINAYDIFDLTTRFNMDRLTFTVAVQNLFNKKPPVVGNTIGSTTYNSGNTYPSTYDALGRRFAVSARMKF